MKAVYLLFILFHQILAVHGEPADNHPSPILENSYNLEKQVNVGSLTTEENEDLQKKCGHHAGRQLKSFGSERSSTHDAPWVVGMAIAYDYLNSTITGNFCSATLISNRHVLTAYHCLAVLYEPEIYKKLNRPDQDDIKRTIDKFRFVFDDDCTAEVTSSNCSIENATFRSAVKSVSPKNFPNQLRDGHMDIAVLELDEPVNFSHDLYPACLSETRPNDKDILDLYAFGTDDRNELETLEGSLQHIRLTNLPCYKKEGIDTFCSRSDKQHTLPGDSGGGYVYKNNNITYVTGVVSGHGQITEIVSERRDIAVAHHLHWICTHTGICVDETKTEQIHTFIDTITPYV